MNCCLGDWHLVTFFFTIELRNIWYSQFYIQKFKLQQFCLLETFCYWKMEYFMENSKYSHGSRLCGGISIKTTTKLRKLSNVCVYCIYCRNTLSLISVTVFIDKIKFHVKIYMIKLRYRWNLDVFASFRNCIKVSAVVSEPLELFSGTHPLVIKVKLAE